MTTGQEVLRALESYRLKPEGQGKWRCNSPLRADSDSRAFSVRIEPDGEHGAYFDHVSEESGSLYDLAKRLGIRLPERTEIGTSKRTYASLDDYAAAHGITAAALTAAGWHFTRKDNRPALEFTTKTGKRWRFLDGEKPVYKSQIGYQRCWYGLDRAVHLAEANGAPLVLCNGEISTVTGQAHGVPALCVTGGENSEIPPDLLDLLLAKWSGALIVAFDCLDKGAKSAPLVAQQLRQAGRDARAVDLKLSKGGDVADFCRLHAPQPLPALLACPELRPAPSLETYRPDRPILHESELGSLPPVSWYIRSELPTHGVSCIFGPSGSGKSFLALDYAQRIAQHAPVVYIAAEGESGMKMRGAAWRKHYQQPFGKLYFHMGAVWMWDEDDVNHFISRIQSIAPKVVVVDTLSQSINGSDSDDREIRAFLRACQLIQHAIDGLVIIIHHSGWSTTARERGSSVLRGACDTMIRVVLEDDVIRVESSKTKDAEPFPTRFMKLLPVLTEDGESRIIVEADLLQPSADARPSPNQLKVLEFLALEDVEDGAARQEIAAATEIPPASLSRIFSRLTKLNFLSKAREGSLSLYRLTEDGRRVLAHWTQSGSSQSPQRLPALPAPQPTTEDSPRLMHLEAAFGDPAANYYREGY